MANVFKRNVVDYQGTTANSSVSRTPPRVTPSVSKQRNTVSSRKSCIRCHYKRLQTCRFLSDPPKRKLRSWWEREIKPISSTNISKEYLSARPVRNIGTFVTVSSQIKFLIAFVLTQAKRNLKRPLWTRPKHGENTKGKRLHSRRNWATNIRFPAGPSLNRPNVRKCMFRWTNSGTLSTK